MKKTAKPAASKMPKPIDTSQAIQQTTPKREPRRPQWDTSLVNKARNAVRKPHQPQWSPAGVASRKVRPDSARSVSSWTPPRENSNFDPNRSPGRSGGSPVKHPSPWTLEGESILDRTNEEEGLAAEEARCDHTPSTADMKAHVFRPHAPHEQCVCCHAPLLILRGTPGQSACAFSMPFSLVQSAMHACARLLHAARMK